MKKKSPHFRQLDAMDCGPTCLRMISKFYGKTYSLQSLRDKSYITREGVSMMGIADAAESVGFRSMGVRITSEQLAEEATLPSRWEAFLGDGLLFTMVLRDCLRSKFKNGLKD